MTTTTDPPAPPTSALEPRPDSQLTALIGEDRGDPEPVALVRDRDLHRRRATRAGVLQAGMARGDLRPGLDIEVVMDLRTGPVFARYVTGEPTSDARLDTLFDTLWRAIAAPPATATA